MARSTSGKQPSGFKIDFSFFRSKKFLLMLGLILLFSSLFLFFAFISHLTHGEADQSVVEAFAETHIKESGVEVKNMLGLMGAYMGYLFIFKWLGIVAFLLPIYLFNLSIKLIKERELIPISKFNPFIVFYTLWVSMLMGYWVLLSDEIEGWSNLCGGIGYEIVIVVESLLGWSTSLFLILLFIIFNMYFLDITNLDKIKEVWERIKSFSILAIFNKLKQKIYQRDGEDILQGDEPIVSSENDDINAIIEEVKSEMEIDMENEEVNSWTINDKGEASIPKKKDSTDLELVIEDKLHQETKEENIEKDEEELELKITDAPIDKSSTTNEKYDPTLDLPRYQYPKPNLLIEYPSKDITVSKEELETNKNKIVETLINFKISITSIKATIGPTVTLYEIVPDVGIKISKIKNLEDDIALNLAALGIRIIAPIPGKGTIGIEVPNKNREMVDARSVITTEKFMSSKYDLPIVLGKTISNEVFVTDLARMPHLLMAGATGQGKSVGLNIIISSLLFKMHPSELKFVMVDPKKVELTLYNKIEKHFLAKLPNNEEAIITDTKLVVNTLNSLCIEMDTRYDLLKEAECRNIKEYNAKFIHRKLNPLKGHKFLPFIILVIDELADLMITAGKEIETPIARLAQLARAIGIHLIVATQRPSVNVITGVIKANFPARLSFRVSSKIDSRTILDTGGADQLIGSGDMLLSTGSDLIRLQCAFIDTPEVEKLCNFISDQIGYDTAYVLPEYEGEGDEDSKSDADLSDRDALFEEAARLIVTHQQGSTSLIQRKMKLGYNRAGRIIDQLELAGIVGPFEGSKAREVLIQDVNHLEDILRLLP